MWSEVCTVEALDTPCYVGYLSVIQRNSAQMLRRAQDLGCQLRPHMKTHKTLQGGVLATGGTKRCIAVSTLAEAEFYAEGGFELLLIISVPSRPRTVVPRAAPEGERGKIFSSAQMECFATE
eukprot:Skav208338  [mRNA]  locus=scaffold1961:411692:420858:+ [translate_table: standard]